MFKYAAILFVFLAGLIHLVIVPDHLSHAPVHGLTFLAIGATQVLWAIAYVRLWRVPILYWMGLGLSGGIVLLWVLTQLIMPPFAAEPEPVDVATIVSKCAEIAAFFSLLIFARRHQISRSSRHVIASAAAFTLAVGTGMFFAGHAAELLFPQLAHDHSGLAHAHANDTTPTHAYKDTAHAGLEMDHHELELVEAPEHASSDTHVHNQAVEASTGLADAHPDDMIDSPAADGQTGITAATNHQHPAGGLAQPDEASLMEKEATLNIAVDHHHHESSADHSAAKAVAAGAENQSTAPDESETRLAADHAYSNEANLSPDHHLDSEIITGLETEASSTVHPELSEDTMEGLADEMTQPAAPSEMADYSQDQMAPASGFKPDPAFGSGPSWQQTPQFHPDRQYPVLRYPSIQNSPEQLQMFRNRWHSAWAPEAPMAEPRPSW